MRIALGLAAGGILLVGYSAFVRWEQREFEDEASDDPLPLAYQEMNRLAAPVARVIGLAMLAVSGGLALAGLILRIVRA